MTFGELRASLDSSHRDERERGGCGRVLLLCDPAAGVSGAEGGGEARD